ncbi:NAD(P)H-binding protein [Streptomyces sp. NPDC002018]|uniref:NmrA family NAD(P)-binding protein n=1 Tax=Streptomyces sp. NPDC002018 TaxID=3364629 RepID=UPI0036C734DA
MVDESRILVTGAAGAVGAVGRRVVDLLRARGRPVRALVHREDERADALRASGAEVVVGDLTRGRDVLAALDGCRRAYFSMSVSSRFLEAAVTTAAAMREYGRLDLVLGMSQLTVSQMNLSSTEESEQQRQHWLAEQVFVWSGLPVTHVRPTVMMENPLFQVAAASVARSATVRLPFGDGRTSPVAAQDVADTVSALLTRPADRPPRDVYELTGAASRGMAEIAAEWSAALGRTVTYTDVPFDEWEKNDLGALDLPEHVRDHIATMAKLHARNRYDRVTHDVEEITGHPPRGWREALFDHGRLTG